MDCHTHLAFGGWRADEFEQRILGRSYLEIARAGGGIAATVAETRAMSEEDLLRRCRGFLDDMSRLGVTTVECKSGYGLEVDTELRLLRVYRAIAREGSQRIVPTYLGRPRGPRRVQGRPARLHPAHDRRDHAPGGAGGWPGSATSSSRSGALPSARRGEIFRAGTALGLLPKLHADQITAGGGAELAAEVGAASADHLEQASPLGIAAMAGAGVVAVSLPLASHYLGQPPMPPAGSSTPACRWRSRRTSTPAPPRAIISPWP